MTGRLTTVFLLALIAVPPAIANVAGDCQQGASIEASHACDTFIEGFLAGALLTDAAIITTLENTEGGTDFIDRAYRTRVNRRRLPSTFLASFCLPRVGTAELVADIRALLRNADPERPLGEVVYDVLRTHYPCG